VKQIDAVVELGFSGRVKYVFLHLPSKLVLRRASQNMVGGVIGNRELSPHRQRKLLVDSEGGRSQTAELCSMLSPGYRVVATLAGMSENVWRQVSGEGGAPWYRILRVC
jgi:hypothetical protein